MDVETVPTPKDVKDAAEFVEWLGRLRVWAGRPSYRRLAALAGTTVMRDGEMDRLPASTIFDVLAGKRLPELPRMELVAAFVGACMRACEVPPDVAEQVVSRWLAEWRRLAGVASPEDEGRGNGSAGAPGQAGVEILRDGRPLVGRQEALRDIERALDALVDGQSQFVAVFGEPGVGKTRLLGELVGAAKRRELVTLWGESGEFEQEMPLAMVVDALDDYLEGHHDWVRQRIGADQCRQLFAAFPSLSPATVDEPVAELSVTGVERYRLYRAIRRLLEELAHPSGVVLILDDVHWADAASVELVNHLLRHPPRGRVLIAVAYRPAQVAPQLAALVGSALRRVWRIPVDPLSLTEVGELLGPSNGRTWHRALHAAGGGNPFYVEALARLGRNITLADHGMALDETLDEVNGLPPTIRGALQVELDSLSSVALLVARAAAVVANEFEPSVVAVAAEVDEDVVLAALDELTERDIVRPVTRGRQFRFRHPLLRNVAYGMAAGGWRLAAHGRLAEHLKLVGAPATVLARHVQRSAHVGDLAAVAILREAAGTVSSHAPATAMHWLMAALRLLPGDSSDLELRLDLQLELARLQTFGGQWLEARETVQQTLRLADPADHARRALAIRYGTLTERNLGNREQAYAVLLEELHQIPDPGFAVTVPLRLRLVSESLIRGDYRKAQEVLDPIPDSHEEWEPSLPVAIAAMRPLPALAALRIPDAIRHIEVAGRLVDAAPDEHLVEWPEPIAWLCWTETLMGRPRSALRRFQRAVMVARSAGQSCTLGILLAGQSRAHAVLGQLPEAEMVAKEAAEESRLRGSAMTLVAALSQQCLVASWTGDDQTALRLGDQAVNTMPTDGEWYATLALYAQALALINAGRPSEGAAALRIAWSADSRPDPVGQLSCCELMSHLEAACGNDDEAVKWADRADQIAHPEMQITMGLAGLARAHALRPTAPDAAAEHARNAADALGAIEAWMDTGRALMYAGISYGEAGDAKRGHKLLKQAAEIFFACKAQTLWDQTIREQRRIRLALSGVPGRYRCQNALRPATAEIRGRCPHARSLMLAWDQ